MDDLERAHARINDLESQVGGLQDDYAELEKRFEQLRFNGGIGYSEIELAEGWEDA